MAVAVNAVTPNGVTELRLADSEKHTFTMNLPGPLQKAIKDDAAKRKNALTGVTGVTDSSVVLDILADHYHFKLVDNFGGSRATKNLTAEEKAKVKAEAKTARENQAAMLKSITEAILAGRLTADMLASAGVKL